MPTVLVYRNSLLPLSETFIKEQLSALRRWRGVLIGLRQQHQLPLDGLEFRTFRSEHPTFLERLRWKIARSVGTVPQSAVARLKREEARLLHAHFGVDAVKAWPIAKILDLPMLVTLHGFDININRDWWEAGHGGSHMRNYPARLLKLSQQPRVRFIAVSEAIRSRAISYGIPQEKILVSYIGIDPAKFHLQGRPVVERQRRVLFVGRLVEKKGCQFLIKAFVKVQGAVPDASLIIVGDGDQRDGLQQLARSLNIRIQFLGALSHSEVGHELQTARVFCLPSIHAVNGDAEGLPMVLLEAQASGVPVVTSAMGGATEGIIEGVTGFSFEERDEDALADRLIHLLKDDATATAMSLAGDRFVTDKFNLQRCTEGLEAIYDTMVLPG